MSVLMTMSASLTMSACQSLPTPIPGPEDSPAAVLVLGDASMYEADEPGQAITLNPQGRITALGQPIGRVHQDGRLTSLRGQTLARLREDGVVIISEVVHPVTIDERGVARQDGAGDAIYFDGDGTLIGANPAAPAMLSTGCQGAVARTCMFILIVTATPLNPDAAR